MYKVLIVEDEVLVRVGLKTTIDWEAIGFTIISEASNGEQGYEYYQKHRPDVVITDIRMPKKDGLWLVENIRKDDIETKILVLTCYDDFSYARTALKLGADDYVLKSEVEDDELVRLMTTIKEKLDVQNKAKEKKDRSLTDLGNLKRTVFADLMKSGFEVDDEVKETLKALHFPISDTSYAFIGLSTAHDYREQTDAVQINEAVLNILYEQLNYFQIAYISGQLNKMQLLFIASANLNSTEMKRILTIVAGGAKQYFDISIKAVYSTVFPQIEQAGKRYKEYSDRAQILFYRFKDNNLIRQMELIHFTEPNVFDLKKQYNISMIEAIGHENIGMAKQILHEINRYFEDNIVIPKIAKLFYSNLLGDLFSSYGFFLSDREVFETYEEYHDQILNTAYLENINEIIINFMINLIHELQSMKYHNSKLLINQALNFIENHYTQDISLEDVAKELNISKYYLCSIFKKETTENMSLYINKLRIEKAKQLLLESDIKIKEVYEKVGYSNQQYFSKIFKKITGMTVMEYKEGCGNK